MDRRHDDTRVNDLAALTVFSFVVVTVAAISRSCSPATAVLTAITLGVFLIVGWRDVLSRRGRQ